MEFKQLFPYLRYVIRIIFVTIGNLLGIPAYIVWSFLLYPIRIYCPEVYWTHVEPPLFKALLGIVSSWLNSGGYKIMESGDDLNSILTDEALVLVNHQSTSDVPFIMTSLHSKGMAGGCITWVMDYIFKFTNFGWVSVFHGDFFIVQGKDGRDEQLVKLKQHLYNSYLPTGKKWMVVFPEGGFLYKRKISSQRYAKKNNYPVLEHVTLPRIGAVKTITDSLYHETQTNGFRKENTIHMNRKLKWVIDITIGYPERDPLSFPGMMAGIYEPRHVHLHYRAYPITEVPCDSDSLQNWLYEKFTEKEELLEQFYNNKQTMDKTDKQKRNLPRLTEQELKADIQGIVCSYIFYSFSSYIFWHCLYKHLFCLIGWSLSFLF